MKNAETNTGKAKQATTCSSPSAEAVALAVLLSGHTHCQRAENPLTSSGICEGCLGDAATIDRELQLPARNAALLCAQGVMDWYDRGNPEDWEARAARFDELHDALARIGKP